MYPWDGYANSAKTNEIIEFWEINKNERKLLLISVDHQTNCDHKMPRKTKLCNSLFVCCLIKSKIIKTKTTNINSMFLQTRFHKQASQRKAWILIASSHVLQVIHLNIFKQNMTKFSLSFSRSKLNRGERANFDEYFEYKLSYPIEF